MSRYADRRRAEDMAEAAREWAELGSRLRGRGLSAEQVSAVLDAAQAAVTEAAGRPGHVEYRPK